MELNQFRDVDVVLDKANDNIIQKQFVSAGDKDGRSLTVQLTDNGVIGEVIGLTLNLRWHNQTSGVTDLSAFYVVDRATSIFKINYPQNMLTPGKVIASIQLLHNGKITYTKEFEIIVRALRGEIRGVLAKAEFSVLDKALSDVNKIDGQLAVKVGGSVKAELEDLSRDVLAAISGGDNTSFNLLSIPQDASVTPQKTTYVKQSINLFNKNDIRIKKGKMLQGNGQIVDFAGGAISHPVSVKSGNTLKGLFSYQRFGGNAKAWFFDENDNILASLLPEIEGNIGKLIVPNIATIAYMLFNLDINPATNMIEDTMLVFGEEYPEIYIPFYYTFQNEFVLNERQKIEVNNIVDSFVNPNELIGKIAVFDGDSIANAINDHQDGWAGRIAENNGMSYTNYAKDGGTITAGLMAGSNPRHWVSRSVSSYREDADYIILEGGTNDADLIGVSNIGTISVGFNATLDDTTFTGAVESTLRQTILKYPGKKIGFIIAHRMGAIDQQEVRRVFFDRIIACCEKWGIPYLDIWKNSYLNATIPELKAIYYSDNQHLTTAGYNLITPMIENWMKSL